jgi:hypothetical protein
MDSNHFSDEYEKAPMPHAIFFDLKGHAIHGTFEPIGHPAASHGCVRLDLVNAATLFNLVDKQGLAHTTVEITGDVMVALRDLKPAPRVRTARRQKSPSQPPDASSGQDVQQLDDRYGGAPPSQQNYPSYGDYAAPQQGWRW